MDCPKCHAHIGRFDWGQTCKKCGVNLIYYNLEETLVNDAKQTELSFGKLRVFAAKVKATFIGGPISIARLVMLFGCIGLLMIPFVSMEIKNALMDKSVQLNALEVYNAFSDGTFDSLGKILSSAVVGEIAQKAQMMLYAIIALAGVCVLQLVSVIVSMISPRKLSAVTAALSVIGIGGSVFAAVAANGLASSAAEVGFISAKTGFGAWGAMIGFAVMFALNLILVIKDVKIKYKDGDLYRAKLYKQVKAGEVKIADLPNPVFETEQEKADRLAEIELAEKNAAEHAKAAKAEAEQPEQVAEASDSEEKKEEAIHG